MQLLNALAVILISSVKLILAAPTALTFEFSFWQTFIFSCLGGVIGVLFFTFFSDWIIKVYRRYFPKKEKPASFKEKLAKKAMNKYGLFGIAFLTPVILSIPFGTFMAMTFFPNKKKTLPVLFASVLGWSFALSIIWTL